MAGRCRTYEAVRRTSAVLLFSLCLLDGGLVGPWGKPPAGTSLVQATALVALPPNHHNVTQWKLFGERNCGTRYLSALLKRSLPISEVPRPYHLKYFDDDRKDKTFAKSYGSYWGWKHSCAPNALQLSLHQDYARSTMFVCMSKNPYSWLLSLWHRPYNYRGSRTTFYRFLKDPYTAYLRDNLPGCTPVLDSLAFQNPMVMWSRKMGSYKQLKAPNVFYVRYEDLIEDPEKVIDGVLERAGFQVQSHFKNEESSTKASSSSYSDYRAYYLNEMWKERWDWAPALDLVNTWLDAKVMKQWGYQVWEPEWTSRRSNLGTWMLEPLSLTGHLLGDRPAIIDPTIPFA